MDKKRQKYIKKANDFENKVVKTINSGAFDFDKGDAKSDTHLIEIKHTQKKGFRITTKILEKIWNESFEANKLPRLIIGIEDNDEIWMLDVDIKKRRK